VLLEMRPSLTSEDPSLGFSLLFILRWLARTGSRDAA